MLNFSSKWGIHYYNINCFIKILDIFIDYFIFILINLILR